MADTDTDTTQTPELDPTLAATGQQADDADGSTEFDGIKVPEGEEASDSSTETEPEAEASEPAVAEESSDGALKSFPAEEAAAAPTDAEPPVDGGEAAPAVDEPSSDPAEETTPAPEPVEPEAPASESKPDEDTEEAKPATTGTSPQSPSVDLPTKIVDAGTPADMGSLTCDTSKSSTDCQVKVGDDHIAQGISAQSIGQARASYSIFGESFADWLSGQGLIPWAAPKLTSFAADKHGADTKLSGKHWSLVVTEFYSQG